jgi:carboxymethylenebutenolidase
MEKMASFGANGGMTDGYLAEAAIARAARGVVVIQEWWGLDDHIKDVTERFARCSWL